MPAAVLLAPGNTAATSPTFTITNTPVTLIAYAGDAGKIEYPGKLILQRENILGNFENFSTIFDGNILLREDGKIYSVSFPGTFRVVRPDLTQFPDLLIGAEISDDSVLD